MKAQRWYEKHGDLFHIYDAPYPEKSISVSIVPCLKYYRTTFHLNKVWEGRP